MRLNTFRTQQLVLRRQKAIFFILIFLNQPYTCAFASLAQKNIFFVRKRDATTFAHVAVFRQTCEFLAIPASGLCLLFMHDTKRHINREVLHSVDAVVVHTRLKDWRINGAFRRRFNKLWVRLVDSWAARGFFTCGEAVRS